MFSPHDSIHQMGIGNTYVRYTYAESHGPLALAVTAGVSLCAVTAVLLAILINGFRTRHQFVRSQVGAYFLSLVLSDFLQAAGSVMNAKWVIIEGVIAGNFCSTQAALKQTGNVGTAIWSLIIALHTFSLLFLRVRISDSVSFFVLAGAWTFIGFIVMMGPVIIQTSSKGPFWGVSGYWCWIRDAYRIEQLTDEYLFMFITAFTSFVVYSLIFLRLRGNLAGYGCTFRLQRATTPWLNYDQDSQMAAVGKQMLWYPVAYTIIILPIAICRWSVIFGHHVPYWATMTADSIFMLSGLINAILYSTTRKIVSLRTLLPFSRLRARRSLSISSKGSLDDIQFAPPAISHINDKPAECPFADGALPRRGLEYSRNIRSEFLQKPSQVMYNFSSNQDVLLVRPSSLSLSVEPPTPSRIHIPVLSYPLDRSNPPTPVEVPQTPTTDDTPSVHRKRFSGWSFPSLLDGGLQPQESMYDVSEASPGSLEEMRFATPSPPNVRATLTKSSDA